MLKIVETRNSLSTSIKDTSTIMRNPLPEYMKGRGTHIFASILLRNLLVSTIFLHGVSLHHHSFSDFCTYFTDLSTLRKHAACFMRMCTLKLHLEYRDFMNHMLVERK